MAYAGKVMGTIGKKVVKPLVIVGAIVAASLAYNAEARADDLVTRLVKNVGKTAVSVPVGIARTLYGTVTGNDIITGEKGLPVLSGVFDYFPRSVINTAEYGVGTVVYDTVTIEEQDGAVNKKLDEMGLVGDAIRNAAVYGPLVGVLAHNGSQTLGLVANHGTEGAFIGLSTAAGGVATKVLEEKLKE